MITVEVIVKDHNDHPIGAHTYEVAEPWDELPKVAIQIKQDIDRDVVRYAQGGWGP